MPPSGTIVPVSESSAVRSASGRRTPQTDRMLRISRRPTVLGIVQAGGAGSRMDVLTRERAKPALPFAGHYQLVDFALSSLANSGISDVWIGVQYQATSLARHVANGRPWDLDRTDAGLQWLMPEEGGGASAQTGFSAGNADDLASRVDDIRAAGPRAVVVMSSDSVFALDLAEVVDEHIASGADCTVVTADATLEQARAKAVVEVDDDGRVTEVAYKSDDPPGTTVATEIFVYEPTALVDALETLRARHSDSDEEEHTGLGDFGEKLLPHLVEGGGVRARPLTGYWRDMGTPAEYLAGHRDLLDGKIDILDVDAWPIVSRFPAMAPPRVRAGAEVADAFISAGCDVSGTVRRSVLGPGVSVAPGAVVEDSVIFARTRIGPGARVATSVVDAGCEIGADARVGRLAGDDLTDDDIALVGRDSRVGDGVDLPAGARLEPGTVA